MSPEKGAVEGGSLVTASGVRPELKVRGQVLLVGVGSKRADADKEVCDESGGHADHGGKGDDDERPLEADEGDEDE